MPPIRISFCSLACNEFILWEWEVFSWVYTWKWLVNRLVKGFLWSINIVNFICRLCKYPIMHIFQEDKRQIALFANGVILKRTILKIESLDSLQPSIFEILQQKETCNQLELFKRYKLLIRVKLSLCLFHKRT